LNSSGKPQLHAQRGTESGTPVTDPAGNRNTVNPDFLELQRAWPGLTDAVKACIVAMIRAVRSL
jgi:hypothetical protein